MARRKKDEGWFELLLWFFQRHSAWWCVPVAFVAFLVVSIAILIVASTSPILRGLGQSAHVFGGVAAFIPLLAGARAAFDKMKRKALYDGQTNVESIRGLSWSEFELLIGEAYRRQGYEVTETGPGADGGIDLVLKSHLETVLVQCKQWKVFKVGVKPIREFYGVLMAEHADKAVFVTSGDYTQEAKDFAKGKPMELIDGEKLSQLVTGVRREGKSSNQFHPVKQIEVRVTLQRYAGFARAQWSCGPQNGALEQVRNFGDARVIRDAKEPMPYRTRWNEAAVFFEADIQH